MISWKKHNVKIATVFIFLAAISLFYTFGIYRKPLLLVRFLPTTSTQTPKLSTTSKPQLNCTFSSLSSGKKKLILLWTRAWSTRKKPIAGWNIDENTLKSCPFNCDFTDNKNLLNISDAIVSHGVQRRDKLPQRSDLCLDQIWTFLNIESPATARQYGFDLSGFDNQFNWTATYRMDSDVPYPYFAFKTYESNLTKARAKFPVPIPTIDSIRNKSLVGWMHSNCKAASHRAQLAERLQKYVPVDIFGRCSRNGRLNCSGDASCYKNLSTHYKFWLAFENSICPDYVTEKLFFPLTYGMVPIVYAHKSVARLLPNNSFINIWDFATIEQLAKHLIYLDQNPGEYLKYFEWRKEFWIDGDVNTMFWCAFCTKLSTYDISIETNRKYYKSIDKWHYNNYTSEYLCPPPSGSLFD